MRRRLTDADVEQIRDTVAGLVDARLADLTELAALRAELIAAKRDRDDWKRQAAALADRNAAYREEIHAAQGPFGHLLGRPDGNADARRGGVKP